MNAYANQIYKTRSVAAASPADQVAMLLETAGRHMNTALEALTNKDYEARYAATDKAQTIIIGLQQCLAADNTEAKPMVDVFDNYYSSLQMMIMRVNVRNDAEACKMVIEGLRQMAYTWRQIGQQQSNGQPQQQQPAPRPAASGYGTTASPARAGLDFSSLNA